MTQDQKARTEVMLAEFAKEAVKIEEIKGHLYGFSSELGCLRIFAKYNANGSTPNKKVRVGYSENQGSWYVSIDMSI